MNALSIIKSTGFDVALVEDGFEITPASALSMQQRDFLKPHKAEIIRDLQQIQTNDVDVPMVICHDCLNLKCFNAHGEGAGTCAVGVQPNGATWWSNTPHECLKFDACVEWVFYDDPRGETVTCYTPNGKPIEVQATSAEHADWLLKMNPKPLI